MSAGQPDAHRRLDVLLRPRSVAIVGASADPTKIGGRPIAFFKRGGFPGRLYPVNPNQPRVQDLPAFRSLSDVPEPVDFAAIALPAGAVSGAVAEAIACGVRSIAVFSAGFAELGGMGAELQQTIAAQCRAAGVPLLGPNCLGFFAPAAGLYPTFSTVLDHTWPTPGPIGLASQSGAFSTYCYGMAAERGLGFSHVIATGNEADVDVAECLKWLADDDHTRIIIAYLEGCRDGEGLRDAFDLAAARGKPVVVMKVGASEVGAAAVSSHTGSLAGADRIYDAVFAEHGVCRVRSINELLNVTYALTHVRSLPRGRRIGVLTTSGGMGILTADEAAARGLELPRLSAEAAAEIKDAVPFASAGNPIDATAHLVNDFEAFKRIVNAMLSGAPFDSIIVFLQQLGRSPKYAAMLAPVLLDIRRRHPDVLTVLCMGSDPSFRGAMEAAGIPLFEDPVDAVAVVDALSRLGTFSPRTRPPRRHDTGTRGGAEVALAEDESKRRLAAAGIPFAAERRAATREAAVAAAREIGFPVVLKVLSADIAHKSDVGGVRLNLRSPAEVEAAWDAIMAAVAAAAPQARIDGVLVAQMVSGGVEVVMGVHRDPVFGMMAMVGLGGKHVEVFNDVAFHSAPVGPDDALAMVNRLKAVALLRGARGEPGADMEHLAATLAALSEYGAAADDVASVEINPYIALPDGGVAVDALVITRASGAEA